MNKKLLLILVFLSSEALHADNKLTTVKDLIIKRNTLSTPVTVREKVESIMPFINLDCALIHPPSKVDVTLPAGTDLDVLDVGEPREIDINTCSVDELRKEYAFQFGQPLPANLRSNVVFKKMISKEYGRVYGMEMVVDKINLAYVSLKGPDGKPMTIRCETKLNTFEKEHVLPVFDTSGILRLTNIVSFRIKKGTGRGSWNSKENPLRAKVGDVIRIFNDDDLIHHLHTYNKPCIHKYDDASEIKPGGHWDCPALEPWNSLDVNEGPLWDHNIGADAQVWMVVTPKD